MIAIGDREVTRSGGAERNERGYVHDDVGWAPWRGLFLFTSRPMEYLWVKFKTRHTTIIVWVPESYDRKGKNKTIPAPIGSKTCGDLPRFHLYLVTLLLVSHVFWTWIIVRD